ncbi:MULTISPECIES: tetratricopeptide repeat protein [Glaesserella]|uniref:UDP-N-acetylglucosamine-peptide N-acetylglucosaminyltransferase n=1 Tax=Glaesserella australis TaxID=2094024 RepID=A0A328BXH6_9PAST|nr:MULTISPECIES: tetratricopeptide repeat protein [Glaesserella]AUI65655.1 hypothetical protein CJD39_03280 [Glaesserella sp. 15-184]RAL19058.1 hypothetical protein C5N92_04485 [Glaesserella australis]
MTSLEQLIKEGKELFREERYDEAINKLSQALGNITNKDSHVPQQAIIHFGLGRCYLKKAIQTKQLDLFDKIYKHFTELKNLIAQLADGENKIHNQIIVHRWLGRCYLEQAKQTKQLNLFDKAYKYFVECQNLIEHLPEGENKVHEKTKARHWLGDFYFKKAIQTKDKKLLEKYFQNKNEGIIKQLPTQLPSGLKNSIASILAVLSISPVEFNKPLAHYTSPHVCEKLLNIRRNNSEQENGPSPMRMNSSTYMNDPFEGKCLAEFLGLQDIALENKTNFSENNAFFTCFSARVNDLNQFRLYGKVDNTEASGCCLVFNKYGNWIKEPDIGASYAKLNYTNDDELATTEWQPSSNNLPLYQIAYIFYRDDYVKKDEYDILDKKISENFGVRLKPISNHKQWEKVRKQKLREALTELKEFFEKNDAKKHKAALEYIRYLFKDYAFRDEEEFRLLKIEQLGSDNIQYCEVTNSTYVEYGDICTQVDEVILGTNYEYTEENLKAEVFYHLLRKEFPKIQVSHSSLPIASIQRKKS